MSNEEMNDEMKDEIQELLQQSVAPAQGLELRRDLWPQMLCKLEEQPLPIYSIPWFDWALAAILSALLLLFPGTIPALLYHL